MSNPSYASTWGQGNPYIQNNYYQGTDTNYNSPYQDVQYTDSYVQDKQPMNKKDADKTSNLPITNPQNVSTAVDAETLLMLMSNTAENAERLRNPIDYDALVISIKQVIDPKKHLSGQSRPNTSFSMSVSSDQIAKLKAQKEAKSSQIQEDIPLIPDNIIPSPLNPNIPSHVSDDIRKKFIKNLCHSILIDVTESMKTLERHTIQWKGELHDDTSRIIMPDNTPQNIPDAPPFFVSDIKKQLSKEHVKSLFPRIGRFETVFLQRFGSSKEAYIANAYLIIDELSYIAKTLSQEERVRRLRSNICELTGIE